MKIILVTFLATLTLSQAAFGAGQENGALPPSEDLCGMPERAVEFMINAARVNCGPTIENFPIDAPASTTVLNHLADPNNFYLVAAQDGNGNSISAVVKCDLGTGQASFLGLQFGSRNSGGGCSTLVPSSRQFTSVAQADIPSCPTYDEPGFQPLPLDITMCRTTEGAAFERSNILKALGEAWMDPSGLVWGDTVLDSQGEIVKVSFQEAAEHCESIGARLPSHEEYMRLSEYMGAKEPGKDGIVPYVPQALPNFLGTDGNGWYVFWTSSPVASNEYFVFNSYLGWFENLTTAGDERAEFRCVVRH